jgi:hypothetical protein
MMNARIRRELMDQMVHEYDMPLVKALMTTISERTGISCSEAADVVIAAWQRSKEHHVDSDCFDHVTAAASATASIN